MRSESSATCSFRVTLLPSEGLQFAAMMGFALVIVFTTAFRVTPSSSRTRFLAMVSAPKRAAVTYGKASSPA